MLGLQDKKQASQFLLRQIIDQLLALVILLVAWMMRTSLAARWAKGIVIVLIALLVVDYFMHSPKLPKKKR